MEGALRICLVYEVVCYHKNEDSEEYAQRFYEAMLTQTLLRLCLHKSIGDCPPMHIMVWKHMVPIKKWHA